MRSALRHFGACVGIVGALAAFGSACSRDEEPLTVHAAASLTDVLPRVAEAWRSSSAAVPPLRWHFGASSRLAKQIEAGAPGDAFFSADSAWMDHLAERGLLVAETRRELLANQLVLVVARSATGLPKEPAALVRHPTVQRIALAGEGVPAGRYARAALESAGAWNALQGPQSEAKVIRADDVRMALAWVARGEAEAGVVYASDAKAEPRVQVAYVFPPEAHAPIRYSAAVLHDAKHADDARAFLDFCTSEAARAIFRAAGFELPSGPQEAKAP